MPYRYLEKNYNLAKWHVQPDVVVFLGDLFDEGSIAEDDEYRRYLRRFRRIFKTSRALRSLESVVSVFFHLHA